MTMAHVTITVRQDDFDETPAVRSKDYADKAEVCADVQGIMEFICSYVK